MSKLPGEGRQIGTKDTTVADLLEFYSSELSNGETVTFAFKFGNGDYVTLALTIIDTNMTMNVPAPNAPTSTRLN